MASPTDFPSLLGESVLPARRSLALRHFAQRLLRSVDLHNPRCPMANPVEFGRELGTDALVDREKEVEAVVQTMKDVGRLFKRLPIRQPPILSLPGPRGETAVESTVTRAC